MKKPIVLLLLFLASSLNAQISVEPAFKDGDRLCFIGNSITHGGAYHNFFQIYNATRFPAEKVAYFNAGVAGDVADGMINRFEKDILIHKPTHAFLMTGMNDVGRLLYFNGKANAEVLKKRKLALDNYFKKTEILAQLLIKNNIKPIFITPSIYDQTAKIKRTNDFGTNDALAICAEHIRQLAQKYDATVVDFYKEMNRINEREQAKDTTFTIVGPDRIHPGELGHLVMAFEVIKTIAPTNLISKTVINARKSSAEESINSEVVVSKKRKSLEFKLLEKSLPFPIKENLQKVNNLAPINEIINNQMLRVKGLKKGDYNLLIDDVKIENFSNKEFKKGINLANYYNTPQYVQAMKVLEIVNKYHKIQDSLRTLSFIEYRMLKNYKGSNSLEKKKEFLYAENAKSKGKSWYEWDRKNINKYFQILPREKKLWKRLSEVRNEIYLANKPEWHTFKIVKN